MDGEYLAVIEMTGEFPDRNWTYPHVIIEEQDETMGGQPESAVARDAESGVSLVLDQVKMKRRAARAGGPGLAARGRPKSLREQPLAGGIDARVVHNYDLDRIAVFSIAMTCFEN